MLKKADFSDCVDSAEISNNLLSTLRDRLLAVGVKHAMVVGSAARDEMSFVIQRDKLVSLSDIEMIIVDHRGLDKDLCRSEIELAAKDFDLGPFFGIDVDFLSPLRLRTLRNRLFTYEAFHQGLELIGSPKAFFSDYRISGLDKIDLALSLLWRVFALEGSLSRITDNYKSESDQFFYQQYFVARNILDLLTVFLYFKGHSETTYATRLALAKELASKDQLLIDSFELYQNAMRWKTTPALAFYDSKINTEDFRMNMYKIIAYLKKINFKYNKNIPSRFLFFLWECYCYRFSICALYKHDCIFRLCNNPNELIYNFLEEYSSSGSISRDNYLRLTRFFPYLKGVNIQLS